MTELLPLGEREVLCRGLPKFGPDLGRGYAGLEPNPRPNGRWGPGNSKWCRGIVSPCMAGPTIGSPFTNGGMAEIGI